MYISKLRKNKHTCMHVKPRIINLIESLDSKILSDKLTTKLLTNPTCWSNGMSLGSMNSFILHNKTIELGSWENKTQKNNQLLNGKAKPITIIVKIST
jgi:hypothetical protein